MFDVSSQVDMKHALFLDGTSNPVPGDVVLWRHDACNNNVSIAFGIEATECHLDSLSPTDEWHAAINSQLVSCDATAGAPGNHVSVRMWCLGQATAAHEHRLGWLEKQATANTRLPRGGFDAMCKL